MDKHSREVDAELVSTILNSSLDSLVVIDEHSRIIEFSAAAEAMFGYKREDLLGNPMTGFIIPERFRQAHDRGMKHYLKTGEGPVLHQRIEIAAIRSDGTEFPIELTVLPTSVAGQPAFVAFVRDITELQEYRTNLELLVEQRTQEVRAKEEQYRKLVEEAGDIVCSIDTLSRITYVNPLASKLLGYSADELLGNQYSDYVLPSWRNRVMRYYRHQFKNRIPETLLELPLVTKSGLVKWVEQRAVIQIEDNGRIVGFQAIVRDVTNRNSAREQSRIALEKQIDISELKAHFVMMASHEFRTPLAVIQATASTLQRYSHKMSDEQREQRFKKINEQIWHLTELLEGVFNVGRIDEDNASFTPVVLNLDQYVQDLVFQLQMFSEQRPILYTCIGNPELVHIDKQLMRRIITHLIINAMRYSPDGSEVSCSLEFAKTEIIIAVTDKGIGIPVEEQEMLFVPRGDQLESDVVGLSGTKRAVDLHNGTIECKSEVGVGTTFIVRIPRIDVADRMCDK